MHVYQQTQSLLKIGPKVVFCQNFWGVKYGASGKYFSWPQQKVGTRPGSSATASASPSSPSPSSHWVLGTKAPSVKWKAGQCQSSTKRLFQMMHGNCALFNNRVPPTEAEPILWNIWTKCTHFECNACLHQTLRSYVINVQISVRKQGRGSLCITDFSNDSQAQIQSDSSVFNTPPVGVVFQSWRIGGKVPYGDEASFRHLRNTLLRCAIKS